MTKLIKRSMCAAIVILTGACMADEVQPNSKLAGMFRAIFDELAEYRGERDERLHRLDSSLRDIFKAANNDPVDVYRNFALVVCSRELTEDEGFLMMLMNERLRVGFSVSSESILRAGLPLFTSEDLEERKAGLFCLNVVSDDGQTFETILQFLMKQNKQGDDLSLALIEFMCQADPVKALSGFRSLFALEERREDELKEVEACLGSRIRFGPVAKLRKKSEAAAVISCLNAMADAPEWWVRLCAAETIRRVPELQTPTLVSTLRADDHAVVRDSMAALEAWDDNSTSPPKHRIATSSASENGNGK